MTSSGKQSLKWEAQLDGLGFWMDPALEIETWASCEATTDAGVVVHIGPLLRLLDDGEASWGEGRLKVGHSAIARMPGRQLAGLGLPATCPHVLIVESGPYSITQPEFLFRATFRDSQGHRTSVSSRVGCLAWFGTAPVVLHEPQYSVLEAIDAFNTASPQPGQTTTADHVNARLVQIAKLHALLGADRVGEVGNALSDDYLRDFRVVVPTQFTLSLSRSPEGVAIDPELLVEESSSVPGASANDLAVPVARQRDFADRFRKTDSVRQTYSLGGGWFVALPTPVQAALRVVKNVQASDAQTRAVFAAQPLQFLKSRLEGELSEGEIESLFYDGDYGDRVSGVGLWQPRVLPWLKRRAQPWLPVEDCGLTIGGREISLPASDIGAVRLAVEEAMSAGLDHLEIAGQAVPASSETLDALDMLSNAVLSATRAPDGSDTTVSRPSAEKHVLLIKDNIEESQYSADSTARRGVKSTPKTLRTSLLHHQQHALNWLQEHWLRGTAGALLADDMGLGKTFETLAFICWLREQMDSGTWARTPVLIVAPTGLLENWRGEMAKHVADGALGNVLLCWGASLARLKRSPGKDTADGIPVLETQELSAADVVLTTYETLRDYQHSFCLVNWSLAVFDEAQKIKNPQTLATSAAKAVANKAALAVALTGTPVENRLSDLWCIVDTVQPLRLGALKQFVSVYEGDGDKVVEARRKLRTELTRDSATAPMLMLRRLKKDHLPGLPRVTVHRFEELMPPVQAEAYSVAVLRARTEQGRPGSMLRALHDMRTISLHPDVLAAESPEAFVSSSARVSRMIRVLDLVHDKGEKALVFVEFQDVQAVLIELLQQRYAMATPPSVINGEVPGDRRKRRVEEFQVRPGFDVMLLSPRAGGVGLTLTAANHVVHLARWWNPAVEDQCTDRVNRIGQTRDVHVYLPLALHPTFGTQSFDYLLDALLERKRVQSEDALSAGEMSTQDVNELFAGATGTVAQ